MRPRLLQLLLVALCPLCWPGCAGVIAEGQIPINLSSPPRQTPSIRCDDVAPFSESSLIDYACTPAQARERSNVAILVIPFLGAPGTFGVESMLVSRGVVEKGVRAKG